VRCLFFTSHSFAWSTTTGSMLHLITRLDFVFSSKDLCEGLVLLTVAHRDKNLNPGYHCCEANAPSLSYPTIPIRLMLSADFINSVLL